METAKMTSKGQLVIPKKIRHAVRAKAGTVFAVRTEGDKIVLEVPRHKENGVADWPCLNPLGVRLSRAKLCMPVTLDEAYLNRDRRRYESTRSSGHERQSG
jgi:AbrB family looped-hinge helix DNA binding protein